MTMTAPPENAMTTGSTANFSQAGLNLACFDKFASLANRWWASGRACGCPGDSRAAGSARVWMHGLEFSTMDGDCMSGEHCDH